MADPAGADDDALGEPQPTAQEQEAMLKKKYGGLLPKNPLICKDHERKFFDSADWALNNQGAARPKPRMPQEDLQPKFEDSSGSHLTCPPSLSYFPHTANLADTSPSQAIFTGA
eukprot:SM000078S22023  [mRNA]  locus=s78:39459:40718:+ [translate_table: standard]